jgi:hypothetical protein
MFRRRFIACPQHVATHWWEPLQKLGYSVYPFATSPEAKSLHRARWGRLWQEELIEGDMGGLVFDQDACVWVNIETIAWPKTIALPPGHYGTIVGVLPPHKIWRSRSERQLIRNVRECLLAQGAKEFTYHAARKR